LFASKFFKHPFNSYKNGSLAGVRRFSSRINEVHSDWRYVADTARSIAQCNTACGVGILLDLRHVDLLTENGDSQ